MAANYTAPTLGELKRAFGSGAVGKPLEIQPRKCQDAQKFIAKLDRAYKATKKSSLQFG